MNEILGTFMKIGKTAFSREYDEFEEFKKIVLVAGRFRGGQPYIYEARKGHSLTDCLT